MSTLAELLAHHADLPGVVADHLKRVVAEWQLLADLSFADFQLWVSSRQDPTTMICVAQVRPNTAPTSLPNDEVGVIYIEEDFPQLWQALHSGRVIRDENSTWIGQLALRREAIPVRCNGQVVAILSRSLDVSQPRLPSALELGYQAAGTDLCQMVSDGTFPAPEDNPDGLSTPRAGDGFIRLDAHGLVDYGSPNALSAYHRMGYSADLAGADLCAVTRAVATERFVAEDVSSLLQAAVTEREGGRMELDAQRATVLLRALPVFPRGINSGAIVLVRDVTELRRRDRALLSKDATIREIHHRVKNNLQSVSALLRLQSRRTDNPEARQGLGAAMRRVSAIAQVHDTLSTSVDENVNLDAVLDQIMPMLAEVAVADSAVQVRRDGHLPVLPAEQAMPLVMVLSELIQNAVEHAYAPGDRGIVTITAERDTRQLMVSVADDGKGLPAGFVLEASDSLGLSIARTLTQIELGGALTVTPGTTGGTVARVTVRLI